MVLFMGSFEMYSTESIENFLLKNWHEDLIGCGKEVYEIAVRNGIGNIQTQVSSAFEIARKLLLRRLNIASDCAGIVYVKEDGSLKPGAAVGYEVSGCFFVRIRQLLNYAWNVFFTIQYKYLRYRKSSDSIDNRKKGKRRLAQEMRQ